MTNFEPVTVESSLYEGDEVKVICRGCHVSVINVEADNLDRPTTHEWTPTEARALAAALNRAADAAESK